jgi:hypothetical protein
MQENHIILLLESLYISIIFYNLFIIRFHIFSNLQISYSHAYLIVIRTSASGTKSLSLQRES